MSIEAPHLQSNLAKLNVAVSEKNFALLQAVFHSITGERYEEVEVLKIQQQKEDFVPTMNPRDVSPELLIKTIESAIRLSRWDMATTTLSLFDTTNSPENQYQCRSLTCRALLEAQLAQGRKGQAFVDQIFVAISFLLQALTIALSQPRYSFLIHNLVMDFNRIMRPTYRTGYRHLLCEPMQKVADALDTLPTEEVDITQQVQHLINLAACYDEAGKVADAEKAISKARTILGVYDASALPLRTRVLCFQVHLARANPKAIETLVAELAKSGDVEWIPGWQGIIAGQKVKSKIIGADEGMVRAELVKALDQMGYPLPAEEGAPVAVKGAKDAARPKSSAPKGKGKKEEKEKEEGDEKDNAKNLDKLAIVGQVGALACAFNLVDLAEHCAMATRITQQSGLQAAWIYSEFTQHKLALMKAEKATSIPWLEEPEAAALQPRIQALKHLEGTLRSAVRLGSADLIQAGCVDIWNIALPLLQIKYRASVTKAFMTASKALSTLDSPLLELRVQLHLELAKCHIDTDALVAATDEVKSALMLDSTLSESSVKAVLEAHKEEEEAMQDEIQYFQRPLDRYLYPLEAKMRLRQDIYNDPSTPEEAAVLKVEQAADARSSSMKKTILLKTFEILEPPNQKVAPNLSQEQRRQRALIWYDIAQLAWRKPRVVDIVVEACERVLSFKWNHVVDRELVVHQVYTLFVQAQCCVEELTYIEYRPGEEVCSTVIVEEGMEEAPIDKTDGRYMQAMQLNTKLLSTLDKAFKVGELLGQHWVVQNAASFLCNMHHHIFHKQAMLERSVSKGIEVPSVVPDNLLNLLRLSYDAMIRLEPACLDIPLLCNTAVAMARAMESRGQYAAGAEICGKVIPLATPLQKREVLFVFARLHRRAGKETMQVPLPTDRESHVLGLIELLRSPLVKSEDKIKLLDQGEDMLRSTDAGAAPNKAAEKKGGSKPPAKGSKAKVGEEVVEVPRKERTPVETDLEAEMWAELATHGLKLGKLVECMRCATEVLKLTEGVMSSARYRWLSIAETVIGQRMIKLIDPLTQNMTSQDGIRTHSLDHFELSISHAKKCLLSRPNSADVRPYEELVVQPTKWYWNTALPFTRNSLTRKVLRKNLHAILEHCAEAVTAMGTTSGLEPELRGQLYCLMAEIFKDDEDWKGGFDLTTTAFLTIPPKNRKDVWQFRVQFMGELGMDVAAGISKMKDNDQLVQANMWVSLARACKNKLDQFDFYQKAIDSISTPILKVDFVVEYAEWLFTKNFPMQDAQDQLSMAADILLDMEPDVMELEEEARSTMGSVMGSVVGSVMGSQSGSRALSRVGSRSGSRAGSRPGSVTNGSQKSSRSNKGRQQSRQGSAQGSKSNRPGSKAGRTGSQASSRVGSQNGGRSKQAGESSAGEDDGEKVDQLLGVKHFIQLVRIYTVLAMMAPTLTQRVRTCLVAHHYVLRIWDACFEALNLRRNPPKPETKKGKIIAIEEPTPAQEPYLGPTIATDWLEWDLQAQEELRAAFKDSEKPDGEQMINGKTIDSPFIVLHYLNVLTKTLCENHFHLQCMPILALVEVIAADVVQSPQLLSLSQLKFARLFDQLSLGEQSLARLEAAEPILPSKEELTVMRNEVEQREQLMIIAAKDTSRVKVVADSGKKLVSTRVELREVFLESATLLVELGRLPVATALVAEARRHCIAFDDMFGLSMCRRVTSRVAELQGNHDVALKAEYMAETLNGDAVFWFDSVDFVVKSLGLKHRKDNLSYQNMKALQLGVIEKTLGVFRAILDHPDKRSMRIEVQRNTGLLLQLKAQVLLRHAHETALDGQPDKDQFDVVTLAYQPALELLAEAVSIFETMEDVVNQIAALRQCAQVRLAYCLATHSPVHTPDLLSLTPNAKSNVHLDFAIELLTRAKKLSETRLQDVRPADIRRDIQLPAAHLHAEVCMELSQVMLLVHNQTRPARIYVPLSGGGSTNSFLATLDLAQQSIIAEIPEKDKEAAITAMFFSKYDEVFGSDLDATRATSWADKSLIVCTSALNLSAKPSLVALNHLQSGQSLSRVALLRREVEEDDNRTQAAREATHHMNEPGLQSGVPGIENTNEGDGQAQVVEAVKGEEKMEEEQRLEGRLAHILHPDFSAKDYSFDTGSWSPRWLVSALKLHAATAHLEEVGDVKTKAGGKKAPPPPKKGAKVEEVEEPKNEVPVDKPAPFTPVVQRMTVKAMDHLYEAIKLGLQHDQPGVVATASMELVVLTGTTDTQLVAQHLALHVSSRTREYGLKLFREAAINEAPENIVLERQEFLNAQHVHPSREKALLASYLAKTSITSQRLSLSVTLAGEEDELELRARLTAEYRAMVAALPDNTAVVHLVWDKGASCTFCSVVMGSTGPTYVSRKVLSPAAMRNLQLLSSRWVAQRKRMQNCILMYGAEENDYLEKLQAEFDAVLHELDVVVRGCLDAALLKPEMLTGKNVILVTDRALFEFPLEALPVLSCATLVSRDFSLHLIHQRQMDEKEAVAKKTMGYIVDPYSQDPTGQTMRDYDAVSTSGAAIAISGVKGSDTVPVPGQWQRLLSNNTAFCYYGYERYLAQLSPPALAGMQCSNVRLVVLNDRATNEVSHRRQSKCDNQKRPLEKEMENVYNTGLLLSMRGVKVIICNQYAVATSVNSACHKKLLAQITQGVSIAQALNGWKYLAEVPESNDGAYMKATETKSSLLPPKGKGNKSRAGSVVVPEAALELQAVQSIRFPVAGKVNVVRGYDKFNPIIIGPSNFTL